MHLHNEFEGKKKHVSNLHYGVLRGKGKFSFNFPLEYVY
jgi:hypothetical protein